MAPAGHGGDRGGRLGRDGRVVGLAVRWAVGGGVAPSFVLVTVLVLAALLVGWRAAVAAVTRHPRKAQA